MDRACNASYRGYDTSCNVVYHCSHPVLKGDGGWETRDRARGGAGEGKGGAREDIVKRNKWKRE